jgi:hypothetical protein
MRYNNQSNLTCNTTCSAPQDMVVYVFDQAACNAYILSKIASIWKSACVCMCTCAYTYARDTYAYTHAYAHACVHVYKRICNECICMYMQYAKHGTTECAHVCKCATECVQRSRAIPTLLYERLASKNLDMNILKTGIQRWQQMGESYIHTEGGGMRHT